MENQKYVLKEEGKVIGVYDSLAHLQKAFPARELVQHTSTTWNVYVVGQVIGIVELVDVSQKE